MIDTGTLKELEKINQENGEMLFCLDTASPSDIGDMIVWCAKHGVRVLVPNCNEIDFGGKIINNTRRKLIIISARDNDIQPTSQNNLCPTY